MTRAPGLLFLAFALSSCSNGPARVMMSGDPSNNTGPACTADDYSTQITAICNTQVSSTSPPAGTLGATCASDGACNSGICLMPFGSGEHYCSKSCPNGTECPDGYTCQDSGSAGPLCYRSICVLGSSSKADCVTTMRDVADAACNFTGCSIPLKLWFDCLQGLPKVCTTAPVDEACGAQAANVGSCCSICQQIDPFYPH